MTNAESEAIKEANIGVNGNTELAIGAAINNHITAKSLVNVDSMRQEATMKDLVSLASTKEGLAKLIETQSR